MKKEALKCCFLLLLFLPVLTGCRVEEKEGQPTEKPEENEVWIIASKFFPDEKTVKKGTTVIWTNRNDIDHTVTRTQEPNPFDSGELDPGKTFSVTFETPGVYEYECTLHPGMDGKIIVE